MQLEFTRDAQRDLHRIQEFGIENFGLKKSEIYTDDLLDVTKLIAQAPHMNNERVHLGQSIRLHFYKAHIIFYRIDEASKVVKIVRILSKRQNWSEHL